MTNDKLADEIERQLEQFGHPRILYDEWNQIIAALRAERPQSGEMVMPRDVLEDIYSLAACDNHCGSNDCPFCSIGNEIRAMLAAAEAERGKT